MLRKVFDRASHIIWRIVRQLEILKVSSKFFGYLMPTNEINKFKLRKKCPLGNKGEEIFLLRDTIISPFVNKKGYWERETSDSIINYVNELTDNHRIMFIDIGSNQGLITRQVLLGIKKSKISDLQVLCVEPHPKFMDLAKLNLSFNNNIKYINGALSYSNEINSNILYFNLKNSTATLESASSYYEKLERIEVELIHWNELVSNLFFDRIIIKCDTDGSDLDILVMISETLDWKNVIYFELEINVKSKISDNSFARLKEIIDKTNRIIFKTKKYETSNKSSVINEFRNKDQINGTLVLIK